MNESRSKILKSISIINLILLYYPTILFIKFFVFGTDKYFLGILLMSISVIFGACTNKFFNNKNLFKRIIINITGSMIIFFLIYFIYFNSVDIKKYTEILIALVFFQLGYNKENKEYWNVLETKDIVLGISGLVFYNLTLLYKGIEISLNIYIHIYSTVFLLLIFYNQLTLDVEILYKSNTKGIPKYINRFNLNLVFKIFIGFIALFNLNFIVKFLLGLLLKLAILIVKLYLKFIKFIFGNSEGAQGVQLSADNFIPKDNSSNLSEIINIIINIVFLIIIILLLIKFMPRIIRYIKDSMNNLISYIKRLTKMRRNFEKKSIDYVDDISVIKENWIFKNKKKEKVLKKDINKNLKYNYYKKIGNINKRIRFMYSMVLYKAKGNFNLDLKKSDTTNDIKIKLLNKLKLSEFDYITNTYNEIRYGHKKVDEKEFKLIEEKFDLINLEINKNSRT